MQDNTITNFTALHDAMVQTLKDRLPLNTCEAYHPAENEEGHHTRVKSPAILVELAECKPGKPVSGGRLAFDCEFVFHCVLSTKTDRVEIEIRNFAAAAALVLKNNRFGLAKSVKAPTDINLYPGVFKPGDKGFESWVVVTNQTVYLGEHSEAYDYLPTELLLGFAPNIGPGHESDYVSSNQ